MNFRLFLPIASLALLVACGDDSSSSASSDDSSSSAVESSSSSDEKSSESKDASSDSKESSSSAAKEVSLEDAMDAFKVRKPENVTVEGEDYLQMDWICSFEYEGDKGFFYIQASPSGTEGFMQKHPTYSTDKAYLYFGEEAIEVKDASYDWGGNHHNDIVEFGYNKMQFKYSHSSFGFGWRSCQEMDCMEVYDEDEEVVINGCTSDRKVPVICRQVNEDGKVENFVDTFEKCEGDDDE